MGERKQLAGPGERPAVIRKNAIFVPLPYKGTASATDLLHRGLAFERSDFSASVANKRFKPFFEHGLVSEDRTMIVIFSDIRGSTSALRELRMEFREEVQEPFLKGCTEVVESINPSKPEIRYPRVVIDKFMGDGALLYVDCGNTPPREADSKSMAAKKVEAALMAMRFVEQLTDRVQQRWPPLGLGVRFGIAIGSGIVLSVLGSAGAAGNGHAGDFTLTGEAVNLAARLEHATPAEFLAAVASARAQLATYSNDVRDPGHLRGTALGEAITAADRHVVDLYDVCESAFQIRTDGAFKSCLDEAAPATKLAWKSVPFAARGFGSMGRAYLLGGNSREELLRPS